uniref:Chitin-binding type-2 domain-containing protein n=1 Tax=Stomoxys calcitrans TaxID=35570 RepID=A0A1I8QE94_STOCA
MLFKYALHLDQFRLLKVKDVKRSLKQLKKNFATMRLLSKGVKGLTLKCMLLFMYCCSVTAIWRPRPLPRQEDICANQAVGDFVENPLDCRLFFLCGDNGEALEASCPSHMVFNSQTKLCDTIENVPQCKQEQPQTQPSTSTPSSSNVDNILANANKHCQDILSQGLESTSLVFIANPQNCYQYFMCYHGQALVQECSTNLYWNSKIGKCDLPSNVQCLQPGQDATNGGDISTSFVEKPAQSGDSFCPLYGHHIFPHMERCDLFIYCVKGYAVLQQCPFFHYFDVESARCKLRTRALCVKDLNLKFRKNTF